MSKLATVLAEVSSAQERWLQEVETASRNPALLADPACRARLSAAMTSVGLAASQLRVQPVPSGFEEADQLLSRAQNEAEQAATGMQDRAGAVSTSGIVDAIQHLDQMSQLLQQAYRLIRR